MYLVFCFLTKTYEPKRCLFNPILYYTLVFLVVKPMWAFEKFTPNPTVIPETTIMSMRNGLEARYADRFSKYAGTTDDYLKKVDQARQASDSLRTAVGVVDTQKENIDQLFVAAEMMVKMIDDFQRESGAKQVKNIPLAGDSIKASYGKKLGYVKLAMKFVSAGMLHFMEMALTMQDDIKAKEAVIKAIAEDSIEVPIIGSLVDINFDELSSDSPIVETKIALDTDSEADSVSMSPGKTSTAATTPATTPVKQVTTSEKKVLPVGKPMSPTPNGRSTPVPNRPAPRK